MKRDERQFTLTVPLDASAIQDREGDQALKAVAKDRRGGFHAATVKVDAKGKGIAKFQFKQHPGPLHIAFGPADASDDELTGMQTLTLNVATRKWAGETVLEHSPVVISSYYWFWWRNWCRTYTVRGKVVCADGSPVPGAEVCAFDVDWWFIWSSKQSVGCATTDIDGTFELKFRWCCSWWPWWWWRNRTWQLDKVLSERVGKALDQRPDLQLSRIENQPSLTVFEKILGEETPIGNKPLKPADFNMLPDLRERLSLELPAAPELEALRVWPWHRWHPWWDCQPDLIFKVTQNCETPDEVILEEGIGDTRWNVNPTTEVTLVVDDNACCRPQPCLNPPCDELDCLVIDSVCGHPFSQIGGNPGAAPAPVGYLNPGLVPVNSTSHHRPFGGVVPISKNPDDLAGVDYYEIEYFDDDPMVMNWAPLPAGAAVNFYRRYWDMVNSPPGVPALFKFQDIAGHNVVETRAHFESNHPLKWPSEPGPAPTTALWLSQNYSLLFPLDTTKFADGTYRFRVRGWQDDAGGLKGGDVIPMCGDDNQAGNEFVLTFDNRVITAAAAHNVAHHCAEGVHLCTTEPDTHILDVRVGGVTVAPCDTVAHTPGVMVEIDFVAEDADDHLAYYVLESSWGLNQSRNLLSRPGATVVPMLPGTPTGWRPGQSSGNYGTAVMPLASDPLQGAVEPHWRGGRYTLSVPLVEAFPDPCCYQLELRAYKRTVVGHTSGCYGYQVGVNGNRTEYSIGVGICPSDDLVLAGDAPQAVVEELLPAPGPQLRG